METIKIDLTEGMIRAGIERSIADALKDSYRNPVREIVDAALKSKEGMIKEVVDGIISTAISDPAFKAKLSDLVLQRMVESALKK